MLSLLIPNPTFYSGKKGSEREVHEVSGNCHKFFRSQEQAEAFLEDWKQTVVDLYCTSMMKALNGGRRPQTIDFDVSKLFADETCEDEGVGGVEAMLQEMNIGENETV